MTGRKSFHDYVIVSPSYKRADRCVSHKLFPPERFYYAVHEEEVQTYSKVWDKLLVIPRSKTGMAGIRNSLLTQVGSFQVQVDDDISHINRCFDRENTRQNPAQLHAAVLHGFQLAEDAGSPIWGINLQDDPRFYRAHTPFSLALPVLGTFLAIGKTELRFDEKFPLKEDYDFFLQHLAKYRRVLRMNFYNYKADHLDLAGGCQEYRTKEKEKTQLEGLRKKWGPRIVRENHFVTDSTNPILKTGI